MFWKKRPAPDWVKTMWIAASAPARAIAIAAFTIALLVGCGPSLPAATIPADETATTAPTAAVPTLPLPVSQRATATPLPALSLPSLDELATATPLPSATTLAATATATPTREGDPTVTPPPTFTPPALPGTSENDHYWLRRPVGEGGVVWTDKYYPYGSTLGGQLRPHHGVEFEVTYNTPVLASASGVVVAAGSDTDVVYGPTTNFYGRLVVIEHDSTWSGLPLFTLYGHLNEVQVAEGQRVEALQVVGLSGATGVANGPHLHFEVRLGNNSYANTYNPLLWLYPFFDRGTVAGRVTWPDGSSAEGVSVTLSRVDGPAPYSATTTYSGSTINADPGWNENFAIDDVVAGYYKVIAGAGNTKVETETWVHARRTTFVELTLP